MSVKSRILQFQQNSSSSSLAVSSGNGNSNANIINGVGVISVNSHSNKFITKEATTSNTSNPNVIKQAKTKTVVTHSNNNRIENNRNRNNADSYLTPILSPIRTKGYSGSSSPNSPNGNGNLLPLHNLSTIPRLQHSHTHNETRSYIGFDHNNHQVNSNSKQISIINSGNSNNYTNGHHKNDLRKREDIPESNTPFYGLAVNVSAVSKSKSSSNIPNGFSMSHTQNISITNHHNPPVNRANKPVLMQKKASMTINLTPSSSMEGQSKFGNGGSPPTKGSSPSSAIPKPLTLPLAGSTSSLHSNSNGNSNGVVMRNKTRTSPATTPTRQFKDFSTTNGNGNSGAGTGRLFGALGWKEKYEESQKKQNHLITLAQKATRDYEELRRRYHEVYGENEKLARRLDGANTQLDSLRKASEAVYDDYYKLKKRYESENREKADALTRVDQYNKENRRLKRQSAAMMIQINDPTSFAGAFDAVCETDSAENDKEIQYLRNRVQDLENKVVDLESELEKANIAEFETQESVMLINDSVNSMSTENARLKGQLKDMDEERHKTSLALEDVTFEYESLKVKYEDTEEKLAETDAELKKIQNEKNILQRQSLVFMNDVMDNRIMDALNQISELQTSMQEQRQRFESQLGDLQNQLAEKESQLESYEIETVAKIRALEDQLHTFRKRAEVAEQRLEDLPLSHESSPERGMMPPPPPPPPMSGMSLGPPPPPPPMPSAISSISNGNASLGNSLKSAMGTLRRTGHSPTSGSSESSGTGNSTPVGDGNGPRSIVTSTPQIDDVISQLKKGIKLKPMDSRTLTRKPAEQPQENHEGNAVEEMRSILNNLRRTRRQN